MKVAALWDIPYPVPPVSAVPTVVQACTHRRFLKKGTSWPFFVIYSREILYVRYQQHDYYLQIQREADAGYLVASL